MRRLAGIINAHCGTIALYGEGIGHVTTMQLRLALPVGIKIKAVSRTKAH